MPVRPRLGRILTAGGRSVHVREDGSRQGKPVVLLHGFSASLQWFDRLTPLLADRYRVIRVDLLGHGSTGGEPADAGEQARMVEVVLGVLGVDGAAAVGHSFGADVAIALAERSRRIGEVVVVAQAPDYEGATFPPGNALMAQRFLGAFAHRMAPRPVVRTVAAYAFAPGFRPGAALDEQTYLDHRAMHPGMFRVVLTERRDRMATCPLDVQLARTGLPSFAILGSRDRFYGARSADRYAAAGARVEILPDAGHSPTVEAPGAVARLLREFLPASRC
ncbi:alpha/beta fold hydrolase [Allosaccharopolyspora coralli]|uniref:Alpha/beta fold hydrolase n=1 Tax=Allosaccharopolyspora coralli TaxID=2665642 RepID=A0A5Q3QAD9_9PSEU|nr:alpha/beta hydrolase [Allosaccharopolyspora coralli]QGK70326.1 alpha/beta fold hydrolase [Allosaccharopolyspora coralli]